MGSQKGTPRAGLLGVKALKLGGLSMSEGLSDVGNSRITPRFPSSQASQQASQGNLSSRPGQQATSRAEFESRRRQKEHAARHQLLLQTRQDDEKRIQERRARSLQVREARFEALLEDIGKDDMLRVEASQTIADHEAEQARRKKQMYEKWDGEVCHRVERQLGRWVTHDKETIPGWREELLASDHPCARELREQRAEERFHRGAELLLESVPSGEIKDQLKQRSAVQGAVSARERSRPVLPVELWGQQHHYASPCGHFAQAVERGGPIHSARRLGTNAHQIDESDGVAAAGKTKTRFEKNLHGMLEGTLAREGQAAQFKTRHGGSSGAPCQDHFQLERGNGIVEAEFPAGKRAFPALRHL